MNSASDFAISVFPTPVGPMNISDAIGFPGGESADLIVAIRFVTVSTGTG